MKKLSLKRLKRGGQKNDTPTRITNETVAEHRERILAGGRRFKYPIQYARHRLVIVTILISLAALVLFLLIGWWQLYLVQNSDGFLYRVTRVLPLPVAKVDGEYARYSDYLMEYRSSIHYLQQIEQVNLSSDDGKRQSDFYKSQAMDNVIASAYAEKLAREKGVRVTNEQVQEAIDSKRRATNGELSNEAYDAVTLDFFGWGPDEHRRVMERRLIQQEVAYSIDDNATTRRDKAEKLLAQPGVVFENVALELGGTDAEAIELGAPGWVPKTNNDGGRSAAAAKLQKDQISAPIKSTTGDGYYFVKLLDSNDTQVSYAYFKIPLTEFDKRLEVLKKDNKIQKYITIPEVSATARR